MLKDFIEPKCSHPPDNCFLVLKPLYNLSDFSHFRKFICVIPTDAKLCKKAIDKCNQIAQTQKKSTNTRRFARRTKKQLRIIAIHQIRKLEKKMDVNQISSYRNETAIESTLGYLKSDFRVAQNYFGGVVGIEISALMAAFAWNLKKMMEVLKKKFLLFIFRTIFSQNLFRMNA